MSKLDVKASSRSDKPDKRPAKDPNDLSVGIFKGIPSIAVLGMSGSGKTTAINKIIKLYTSALSPKQLSFLFIGDTMYNDPSWAKIFKSLSKYKKLVFEDLDSTEPDEEPDDDPESSEEEESSTREELFGGSKAKPINKLSSLAYVNILHPGVPGIGIKPIYGRGKPEPEPEPEEEYDGKPIIEQLPSLVPKSKKGKAHKYLFVVMDDLSDIMRDKRVARLIKKNRHFRLIMLLSMQDLKDVRPSALNNLKYILLMGGNSVPDDRLQDLYEKIAPHGLDYARFKYLYSTIPKFEILTIKKSYPIIIYRGFDKVLFKQN